MDVREKLVELLKEISYDQKLCWYDLWDMRDGAEDIADLLIAHGVTVQEWIPVTERLPEHKGNYLGFTGSTTMVGYYKGNGIWWVWLNDVEGENLFTHWMPLPQPPKGE